MNLCDNIYYDKITVSAEIIGKQTPRIIHLESETIAGGEALGEELGYKVEGFDVFVEKARLGHYQERERTHVRKDGTH